MYSRRKRRFQPIPTDLDEESLAKRLTQDLTGRFIGSVPGSNQVSQHCDEKLLKESRNDWLAVRDSLYFGYREFGRVVGKEVRRVSAMPFSDIVLSSDGNEMLTPNANAVIKRLSTMFFDARKLHIHNGPFGCIREYPYNGEKPIVEGDRPLPYFYSCSAPVLKGRVFHTVRTSAQGRVIRFVRIGGEHVVPEELREQVLYLVPADGSWCAEVATRILPLDWQPSCYVLQGTGKKLQILADEFSTTSRGIIFEDERRRTMRSVKIWTVLEICDGVVESVALDEEVYDPRVVKLVHEAAGKRVLLYRPLKESDDEYEISHKILKRIKRYDQLLQKIGGTWPKTIAGLVSCLSVNMTELIVAGMFHPDVRERFPGLYCFLERLSECVHGRSEKSLDRESDDGACAHAVTDEKDCTAHFVRGNEGLSVAFVMSQFYTYSPITRSYYAINRDVDKPVVISSDGKVVHFTESDVPVPVLCTPYGIVACGWL